MRLHALAPSRGQTLVEFAMVLPIIILLVLGTVDLGRAVFTYNTLAQSARSASRLAIVNQDVTSVKQPGHRRQPPTLGLTSSNVDVCFKTPTSNADQLLHRRRQLPAVDPR